MGCRVTTIRLYDFPRFVAIFCPCLSLTVLRSFVYTSLLFLLSGSRVTNFESALSTRGNGVDTADGLTNCRLRYQDIIR